MNIRSITGFLTLADPFPASALRGLAELARAARENFSSGGFPVQTVRLATQPLNEIAPRNLVDFARALEAACRENEIGYVALGAPSADVPNASLDWLEAIPPALAAAQNVFASVQIASHANGIRLQAVRAAARVIRALADAVPGGLGNFRFAALANCPPHSPFFPAAYHSGGAPAFALATEAAPLAVEALTAARTLDEARSNLVHAVEQTGQAITRIAQDLASGFGLRFAGIDFSLAPSLAVSGSIATAIERLTGTPFGERGTLFAAGFLTDCLQRAQFPRTGFCSLMLPVLEDATLAARSGNYSLDSLLLYSTVCGTGLDTVPLPGEVSADALAVLLLDVATLAVKLNKPLTARLIPIPNAQAGEMTRFDSSWFTNAQVMPVRGALSRRLAEGNDRLAFGG